MRMDEDGLSSFLSKIRIDFLRPAWPRNWAYPGKTHNRSPPWIASLQRQNVVEVAGFQFEVFRKRERSAPDRLLSLFHSKSKIQN
jgi:hypothetical protein